MLTDPDDMLNTGVEVEAARRQAGQAPPAVGWRRSLVAVAFLVALFSRPSPFILDRSKPLSTTPT